MTIRGHSERSYTQGTPPAGLLAENRTAGMITDDSKSQQKEQNELKKEQKEQKEDTNDKYWVSERSVGDFMRTFRFPTGVDQEKVKASMKDGILSIVVPKVEKAKGHKIPIEHWLR